MSRLPVTLVALALLTSVAASAQVPKRIGYQGRLLKADGVPATGALRFTFTLYDAQTGGAPLWTEEQTLALSEGLYSTQLGAVVPLAASLFGSPQRFLELKVEGETLSPRQQLSSAPFAMVCESATNVTGGSVNASSISVGG